MIIVYKCKCERECGMGVVFEEQMKHSEVMLSYIFIYLSIYKYKKFVGV